MLNAKRFFALLMFFALVLAFGFTFSAQARRPTVLVINTSSDQYGRCCPAFPQAPKDRIGTFFDGLFKHLGYTDGVDFKEIIDDVNDFDKELFSLKWDIFVISYHGLQESPDLQEWVNKNQAKISNWIRNGHGVVSTGGRDPEDIPLVEIFDISKALVPTGIVGQCCVNVVPNTPLTKGMSNKIDASKSNSPTLFGDGQAYDKEKLPEHTKAAALHPKNDKIAAIIYGKFGRGGYVFGSAEITSLEMGFGIPEMSEDSFIFWQNLVDWFATEGLGVVRSAGKLGTTWARIKTGY